MTLRSLHSNVGTAQTSPSPDFDNRQRRRPWLWNTARSIRRKALGCLIIAAFATAGIAFADPVTPSQPDASTTPNAAPSAAGAQESPDHVAGPAYFRPRISMVDKTVDGRPACSVTIDEQTALTILTAFGGFDPTARAQITSERLEGIVTSQSFSRGLSVGAQPVDSQIWVVTLQGGALLLVTRAEAAAHRTAVAALARQWAWRIARLLSEVPIHPAVTKLVVPLGETRSLRVGGAARATDIAVTMADAETVNAAFDPQSRLLTIKGLAQGKTTIGLNSTIDGPASAAVAVEVMPYAGHVDAEADIGVTGSPAPPTIAERAFFSGLACAVTTEPGAVVHVLNLPRFDEPLDQNKQITLNVPIQIDGPDLLPVRSRTTITISNQPVNSRKAATLLYSNDPEEITQAQTLFTGRLYTDMPARLVYHHQNVSGSALEFQVDLVNEYDTPLSVQVLSGIASPGIDTIQVGRRAGAAFIRALADDAGVILNVPAYSSVPIVAQKLPSLDTASGLLELRIVAGTNPATVKVAAGDDPGVDPVAALAAPTLGESWPAAAPQPLPPHSNQTDESRAVFRWPHIDQDLEYDAGGQWTYLRLGDKDGIKDAGGALTLDGNYGADYNFDLTLKNPGTVARTIGLIFAPEAGTAAGVFTVDGGPIIEVDPTSPPDEINIARYTLAPGESRAVHVWTIPLSGSYYPASIIVHNL